MKTTPKHYGLGILVSVGLLATAQAGLITPDGDLHPGNDEEANISTLLGFPVTLLYRANYKQDGTVGEENGFFAPDGPPNFTITPNFPMGETVFTTAEISWDLTGTGFELSAVAWKFGNLFRFSGIHDDQYLVGGPHTIDTGAQQAVSHVSFYGVRGGHRVPDGGTTLIMLGSVLTGFGLVRRLQRL